VLLRLVALYISAMKLLIEYKIDINAGPQGPRGRSFIDDAMLVRNNRSLKFLLEEKADISSPTAFGILDSAVTHMNIVAVGLLIRAKIDVSGRNPDTHNGTALIALMRVANYSGHINNIIVSKLLKAKADVNALDDNGYTALIVASTPHRVATTSTICRLLDAHADVNAMAYKGCTALASAVMFGCRDQYEGRVKGNMMGIVQ